MIYCFLIDFNEISGTPNNGRPILSRFCRTLKPKKRHNSLFLQLVMSLLVAEAGFKMYP